MALFDSKTSKAPIAVTLPCDKAVTVAPNERLGVAEDKAHRAPGKWLRKHEPHSFKVWPNG